jgi:ribosomal protein L7/L12
MDTLPPEAVRALKRGQLIEAIKIVRDSTGMDLKSAKEAVERYAHRQQYQPDWPDEGDGARTGPDIAMQDRGFASMPSIALAALAQGNKIEAIRLTREATGLDLAAAKRLVENHENPPVGAFGHLPSEIPRHPMAEPGRVQPGSYSWLPVVIILLAAVVAWMYFGTKG